MDPTAEIARIRQSIALLESHILHNGPMVRPTSVGHASVATASPLTQKPTTQLPLQANFTHGGVHKERARGSYSPNSAEAKADSVPGLMGQSDHSGFFAGPTSALSHLLSVSQPSISHRKSELLMPASLCEGSRGSSESRRVNVSRTGQLGINASQHKFFPRKLHAPRCVSGLRRRPHSLVTTVARCRWSDRLLLRVL